MRIAGMSPSLTLRRTVRSLTPSIAATSAVSRSWTFFGCSFTAFGPRPGPGQLRQPTPRRRPGGQGPQPAGGRVASAASQAQPEGTAPGWASAESQRLGVEDRASRSALISITMPMASKSQSKNLAIFGQHVGSNACGFLMEAFDPREILSPPRGQIYRGRAPWAYPTIATQSRQSPLS